MVKKLFKIGQIDKKMDQNTITITLKSDII